MKIWFWLKHLWCRCDCHQPSVYHPMEWLIGPQKELAELYDGTLTHHDRACCDRYYGTVNFGWTATSIG